MTENKVSGEKRRKIRKMNSYVAKLKEISEQFPNIIGKKIPIYNSGRELIAIRTITGIFKDDDYKNGALVFLLDDGKHIVKRLNEINRLIIDE